MQVTRLADARPYEAPKHFDMRALRLQGHDASDAGAFWVGLSHFLPGGGAERSAGAVERVYIVTAGAITVTTDDDGPVVLNAYDSCWLAPGEARAIVNHTNQPATAVVVMEYADGAGR
jgi:quercetin dioxygenase-like cupin family protein